MEEKHQSHWPVYFVIIVLLMFGYVASYPVAVRIYRDSENYIVIPTSPWCSKIDSTELSPYQPVDWLIDNTPIKKPMMSWAEVWEVEHEMDSAFQSRFFMKDVKWIPLDQAIR